MHPGNRRNWNLPLITKVVIEQVTKSKMLHLMLLRSQQNHTWGAVRVSQVELVFLIGPTSQGLKRDKDARWKILQLRVVTEGGVLSLVRMLDVTHCITMLIMYTIPSSEKSARKKFKTPFLRANGLWEVTFTNTYTPEELVLCPYYETILPPLVFPGRHEFVPEIGSDKVEGTPGELWLRLFPKNHSKFDSALNSISSQRILYSLGFRPPHFSVFKNTSVRIHKKCALLSAEKIHNFLHRNNDCSALQ